MRKTPEKMGGSSPALALLPSRRLGVDVAGAAHGLDALDTAILVFQLPAQLADVHVDAAIERIELSFEHLLGQLFPRHDLPGCRQQDPQHVELYRRQGHRLTVPHNCPRARVENNVADLENAAVWASV